MLQTPYQDEQQLKSHISRLSIKLDAHAISSSSRASVGDDARPSTNGSHSKDNIWTGAIDSSQDPVIVVEESVEGEDDRDVFVIWKLTSVLSEDFRNLVLLI